MALLRSSSAAADIPRISLYVCHHLFIVICKGSSYNLNNVYNACSIRKMVFLTIEEFCE